MVDKKQFESLHTHTSISDGTFNHLDILNMCPQYNIGTVAFTDHDILPDKKILRILEQNRDHKTKWIIGCEFSSALPKELAKNEQHSLHILGLFLDPHNKDLIAYSDTLLANRVSRLKEKIKNLKNLGFDIDLKDCKISGSKVLGLPHLVKALSLKEVNMKIIDLWIKKMAQESINNLIIKKKYNKLLQEKREQYPYTFLKDTIYEKKDSTKNSPLLDLDNVVRLIRGAGGIASIAHWIFSKETLSLTTIEKLFKENRLDGGEIVFGFGNGRNANKETMIDMRLMRNLIIKHNKIPTGGPDMHLEEDFNYFSGQKSLAKKTIGLTQNIINKTDVDIRFSSL